jgi:molybdate transport system regulatory protein
MSPRGGSNVTEAPTDATFDASLRAGDVTFDAADAALLRAVASEESVSGAASSLGRSRSRALDRLKTLEAALGPLVERRRGGAGGGGSRLTEDAEALLARFDRLRAALSGTAGADEAVLTGEVASVRGELGIVATPAGDVRALLVHGTGKTATDVPVGTPVQVSIRADAVTLHAPTDAPPGEATSARNRFSGRVTDLSPGETVVHVRVDVDGASLVALVTAESVDRLALHRGDEVVASFKATATRATPR